MWLFEKSSFHLPENPEQMESIESAPAGMDAIPSSAMAANVRNTFRITGLTALRLR
jgi:hypothetical protein